MVEDPFYRNCCASTSILHALPLGNRLTHHSEGLCRCCRSRLWSPSEASQSHPWILQRTWSFVEVVDPARRFMRASRGRARLCSWELCSSGGARCVLCPLPWRVGSSACTGVGEPLRARTHVWGWSPLSPGKRPRLIV